MVSWSFINKFVIIKALTPALKAFNPRDSSGEVKYSLASTLLLVGLTIDLLSSS
jgi:hypothetical protein